MDVTTRTALADERMLAAGLMLALSVTQADVKLDETNGTTSDLLTNEMLMMDNRMMTGDLTTDLMTVKGAVTLSETMRTVGDLLMVVVAMAAAGDFVPDEMMVPVHLLLELVMVKGDTDQTVLTGDVTLDETKATAADFLTDEMKITGDLRSILMMMNSGVRLDEIT